MLVGNVGWLVGWPGGRQVVGRITQSVGQSVCKMTWTVGLHGWPVSQWENFHGQSVAGLCGQSVVSSVGSVNQKLEWCMGLSPDRPN